MACAAVLAPSAYLLPPMPRWQAAVGAGAAAVAGERGGHRAGQQRDHARHQADAAAGAGSCRGGARGAPHAGRRSGPAEFRALTSRRCLPTSRANTSPARAGSSITRCWRTAGDADAAVTAVDAGAGGGRARWNCRPQCPLRRGPCRAALPVAAPFAAVESGAATLDGLGRKRGKLHELNRLLRGASDTSFQLDAASAPHCRKGCATCWCWMRIRSCRTGPPRS